MPKTRLTKRGIYDYRWDGDRQAHIEHRVSNVLQLLSCWHDPFEAEEGFTFGDLMHVLRAIAPENDASLNRLLDVDLGPFLEEAFSQPAPSPEAGSLNRLEVYWDGVIEKVDGRLEYHDAPDCLHAWGPPDEHGTWLADGAEEIPWSVSMTPLYELMHLPLVFNSTWRPVYDTSVFIDDRLRLSEKRRDHRAYRAAIDEVRTRLREQPEMRYPMAAIARPFTLGWALRTIFMDLGFYGLPGDRNEVKAELAARLDEIDPSRDENRSGD